MEHAIDFHGDHEVVEWKGRLDDGVVEFFHGWKRVRAEEKSKKFDLIVCQAFGSAFGIRKGGKLVRLRHFFKAGFEQLALWLVLGLQKSFEIPLVAIDVSDDCSIHPLNRNLLERCRFYFKRELPLDPYHAFESFRRGKLRVSCRASRKRAFWRHWVGKLRPLPLGCTSSPPKVVDFPLPRVRSHDVFYVGDAELRPRREGIEEVLGSLKCDGVRVNAPRGRLSMDDYLAALADCSLALSPPGFGWDCHRHYEAALVGTVALTSAPSIQRVHPLLNGEHCLFYDEEKDLKEQILGFLEDKSELESISQKAQAHASRNFSHEAIFDYVVSSSLERVS